MLRQDVLIAVDDRDGAWTFIACSAKGAMAIVDAGGGQIAADVSVFSPVNVWRCGAVEGRKVYVKLRYLKSEARLDCHLVDYMPFSAVLLNAERMTQEYARKEMGERLHAYFEPLISDAIERRDKARITELFNQYPQSVEKAMLADRLIHDPAFPELRQVGVTLQNWS